MLSIRRLGSPKKSLLKIVNFFNEPRVAKLMNRRGCGNREVVGYGINGRYMYGDHQTFPFPAIRFRENTPDLLALREKERGDWRRLSMEEKKILYRASFCSTFAEMDAPTGQWKSILANCIFLVCAALWLWIYVRIFVNTEAPKSFSEESRAAQYWRQEAINNEPFSGNYKPKNADKYKPFAEENEPGERAKKNDEND
ncbi:cytochrome c oxidase subunit 4 isoform 1, mitochondrial-like [Venturia canescens]|uniref:cytochrome c oxidase subunit 4 isoform 1, mitochondrial-like n=1 Tax=Venturia canescens TaxID=32260 RepID=UPI001C9C1FFD|nr:cytochrome c oxidase subunit 4 isoform 1, mitochondrial-like [Venturia canescens]